MTFLVEFKKDKHWGRERPVGRGEEGEGPCGLGFPLTGAETGMPGRGSVKGGRGAEGEVSAGAQERGRGVPGSRGRGVAGSGVWAQPDARGSSGLWVAPQSCSALRA